MAAEDKDDYYTKTAADAEFLTSNQGSANADKFLKVNSAGSVICDDFDVDPQAIEDAVDDYLTEHPVSGLTPEDEARVEAVEGQVFKSGVTNTNLFNKHNIIDGRYLSSNGSLSTNVAYYASDYMEIPTGTQYMFVNFTSTNRIAFYNSSKTFISPLITLSAAGSTVDISELDVSYRACFKCVAIPEGAKYARMDCTYTEINSQKVYTSTSLDAADLPPTVYVPWNNTEIDDEMTDVQDELSRVSMLSLEEVKAGELVFAVDLELTYVYGGTWRFWAKTFPALEPGDYTFVIKNISNLDTRLLNTITIDTYCSDTNTTVSGGSGRGTVSYTPSGCTLNTIDGTAYLHFTLSNSNTMWSYGRVIRPRIQFTDGTAVPAPEVPAGETPPTSVTQYCRVVLYKGNVTATTLSNIVLGEEVVADLTTQITNSVKDAIDVNGKLDKIYTKNLFDKSAATTGYYWAKSGNKGSNASYAASALIPVQPNTYYYCTSCGAIGGSAYCVFAADKRTLLQTENGSDDHFGTNQNLSGIANCILTPANAAYLGVSISAGSLNSAQVEIGQVGTTYEAYGDYLPVIELDARMTQAEADIQAMGGGQQWKDSAFHTTAANFNDGDVMTLGNNKDVKNHKQLTFYAKIAENGFSALQLGHGDTSYGGTYIEVDDTNVKVYNYSTAASLSYTLPHGITEFKDYIQITIACRYDGVAELHIETFDQQYTKTNQSWSGCNGRIYAKSIGSTMTDATLSWSCDVLSKPIWLFGDSYLGLTSTVRPYYYPIQEGYKNWIACGYPGAGNSQYECLVNLLQLGKPKVAIWTIGMNCGDPDENTPQAAWVTATTNFITACKNAGVLPIISTIPSVDADGYSPDSGITGKRRNWAKDAWVRASGERYVDFAAAVDPDDDGVWLDGYLSSDSVHPATPGAKALARQLLVDVPEMISTKVWA